MRLDIPTLMIAAAFVAACSAGLLFYAWHQYRETSAAMWWSAGNASLAASIVLMAAGSATGLPPLFAAGLIMLLLSGGLIWNGARVFDGHRTLAPVIVAGPVLWIAANALWPGFAQSPQSLALHVLVSLAYYGGAGFSIMRARNEGLQARAPLAALLWLHAATLQMVIPASLDGSHGFQPPVLFSSFSAIHFETIIFVTGTALFLVAMMKERSELRFAKASQSDPLTGLLNRRGFLERAGRVLERSRRDGLPSAVVLFDLDHFKTINDRFGHDVGDQALQLFAETCRDSLRASDIVGRLGGEEFAVVLPGVGFEDACMVADRIRRTFGQAARIIAGNEIGATLSGGVSLYSGTEDIHELLKRSDTGLYRAKALGRNRIERSEIPAPAAALEAAGAA